MSRSRFESSTVLPVSPAEAFAWHARPGAFERLLPPWLQVEVLSPARGLEHGSRISFRQVRAGVPWRWTAEHRDVEPGRQFRDVQIDGPFASWDHLHSFLPDPAGCRLRDEIVYALPGGAIGRLLGEGSVRAELERLFRFRHRTTSEDLAAHAADGEQPRLHVAIAGASGLIGSAFGAFLTTGRHAVTRLVRRPPRDDHEVEWKPAQGLVDGRALERIDALVYLAGENIAGGRWTRERKEELARSRVEAVERLLASLRRLKQPPKVLVCASAIGFYGDRGDAELDETSAAGDGFLAALTQRWEEAARRGEEQGLRVALMRFGVVLSPRGGALAKMLPAFRLGAGGPLGRGRQYLSWIGLDDAVGALHHVLRHPEISGPVNVTAPAPVPQGEFASTLGRVLERPAVLPVPALALRAALGEMAREALLASTRAFPRRLLETGYHFRQPRLADSLAHGLGRDLPQDP